MSNLTYNRNEPSNSMLPEDTIPNLLRRNYEELGETGKALKQKKYGIWNTYTWKEFYNHVKYFSLGLISVGLKRKDVVLITGDNEPEWIYASLGTQSAGATFVGAFADSAPRELKYLIKDSAAKIVVAQGQEQVDKLLEIKDEIPLVEKIIYWEDKGLWNYPEALLMPFEQVLKDGRKWEISNPGFFEAGLRSLKGHNVGMLAYTSGTTGDPKGVMLTHQGLLKMCKAWHQADPLYKNDLLLSFVPLAWGAEHFATINRALYAGSTLCFSESPETVQRDLREIGFSVGLISPKLLEQQISLVETKISESGPLQRLTYKLFMPIGYKVADLKLKKVKINMIWKALYGLGDWFLFRQLRDRLGYSLNRTLYTAGSIIAPESYRFYIGIGVNLKCLYAMTETSGTTVLHRDGDVKPETTGLPLPDCDIRISEEGEIQVKCPGLLVGYRNKPEAYQKIITHDGWLHTDDAGLIDEDGHLIVMDRLAEMVKLKNGTIFAPQYLESKIRFSRFIKEIILFGHEKPYISALISIDYDVVGSWAEKRGISYTSYADLSQKDEVYKLIWDELTRINMTLPENWRVKRYALLVKDFDPDDAELTRLRKLRREHVSETYKSLSDALYSNKTSVETKVSTTYRDGRTKVETRAIQIKTIDES